MRQVNKKGLVANATTIAFAVITLAVIVGIGIAILTTFGSQTASCPDPTTSVSVTLEAGKANGTGYQLTGGPRVGYGFTLVSITAVNLTDHVLISSGNYTVNGTGYVKNATAINWPTTEFNYTYTWQDTHTWDQTTDTCLNNTGGDAKTVGGAGHSSLIYGATQMGTTNGGLMSWVPTIIVVLIGFAVITWFAGKKHEY